MVIDGGSSDGSSDIILRYEDNLAHWESEPDHGQSHAINKGLRRATGDILGWVNSDDTLYPNAIGRAVEVFEKYPDVDVVHGVNDRMDERGIVFPKPRVPIDHAEMNGRTVLGENLVNSAGAFWRRSIMDKVGLLDESLHYVMDYDFWFRIVLAGGRFYRLPPPPLASLRVAEHAKTVAGLEQSAIEALSVLDRYLGDPDVPAKLGMTPMQMKWQGRKGRAYHCLRGFYGSYRLGRRTRSLEWLLRALFSYPPILLQRRWFALAAAKIQRDKSGQ